MLSADDYCRTVKSYEWLQNPGIYSGVWLSPHFWINGFAMLFIENMLEAAAFVNIIYSTLSLIIFFKICEITFDKVIAFWSTLIFAIFPFQVWLGISGLSESIFFFFALCGIYYFLQWMIHDHRTILLILSAVAFAINNLFRYEGWLFTIAFLILVLLESLRSKKFSVQLIKNLALASISGVTILWWIIQNYVDHGDAFFFASETTKIFNQFSSASFFQRLVQYPSFIFYTAPLTTIFAIKPIFEIFKRREFAVAKYFVLFNIIQIVLLILHGILGTGGTNMISRYIILNALLLLPLAVYQFLNLKKIFASTLIVATIIINIVWSFYYPQPYREDTFEIGYLLKDIMKENYITENGKVYFEEVEGYHDIWAVKSISNNPDKFLLGIFPVPSKDNSRLNSDPNDSDLDPNILDVKNFLEKNNVQAAVVKSDSYRDKLSKLQLKFDEVGEYKIFYVKDRESNMPDSTIPLQAKNVELLDSQSTTINFGKLLALKNFNIDNTNFGLNPQTVVLEWASVDRNIIDSLSYEKFDFGRYKCIIEIRNIDTDSSVYNISSNIFSERAIEDLLEKNVVKNIVVLRPFAILQYSRQHGASPFEGGVYSLALKVRDNKTSKDIPVYKGNKLLTRELINEDTLRVGADTANVKDTLKKSVLQKIKTDNSDSVMYSYNLGSIIAMFPDSDFNKIAQKKSDFIRITTQNWIQLLFSQRYQGDHVLNWIFNYF